MKTIAIARRAVAISEIVGIVVGFMVAGLLLAALTPTLVNSFNDFYNVVNNTNNLKPIAPLVEQTPLILVLSLVVGLIFVAIQKLKT